VIVVDTSAIVAIFRKEEGWEKLVELLGDARGPAISAATALEATIVLGGRAGDGRSVWEVREFLDEGGMVIHPVTASQAWMAADAYRRFGKGYHPARLNYGDCFSYALAKELDVPLLYKGSDFAQTDIRPAL
jgi:ribonuclease VapC